MQTRQINKTSGNKNRQKPSEKKTPAEGNDNNVLNKQKQDDPVNPQDNYFEDKKNKSSNTQDSKRDGKKNANDENEGSLYKEELPGQDDDSGKTIKQTPKM